jgi:hypothetical protein
MPRSRTRGDLYKFFVSFPFLELVFYLDSLYIL